VALEPSLRKYARLSPLEPDFFCLRIDADEYSPGSFDRYMPLFRKRSGAVTVFFNAFSFSGAPGRVLECRDIGIDVQSHAFYHYTYGDYRSNRYNIGKARRFFGGIGIETVGFAAPQGRWNVPLTRALADEGYLYSSDFSYDYMGFPSYPFPGENEVLQIPVFPVAPELFFRAGIEDPRLIAAYYKNAIDEMLRCALPVVIYAHTDPEMPSVPAILEEVSAYALEEKGLRPLSMTGYYRGWQKGKAAVRAGEKPATEEQTPPGPEYRGERISLRGAERIKSAVKRFLDFERTTPAEELRCGAVKRTMKLLARKVI